MEANDLDTTYGLTDDELTERFREAVRIELEIRRIKGLPIARYDPDKRQAYIEYPDGSREYYIRDEQNNKKCK